MTTAIRVLPLLVIFPLLGQVGPALATEYPSSDWISDGLKPLPFLKSVVVAGPKNFTKTILHIRDWHFLPKDAFVASVHSVNSEVSDPTLDELHRDFLREVEVVQAEQIALLRFLIKRHGLRQVYSEGLTKRDLPIFAAKIRLMGEVETELPEYKKQLAETRQRLKELRSEDQADTDEYRVNKKLAAEIKGLMHQHRLDRLCVGAAGRLLMTGELVDVLALEEEEFFTAAIRLQKMGLSTLMQRRTSYEKMPMCETCSTADRWSL